VAKKKYGRETKFIFITGGVVSSLGKGIVSSSLGLLLKSRGLRVTIQKFDPYINVDPGTMSPYQHGEVYVTDDGAEIFSANDGAIISARQCRLFRILPMKSVVG
jgi:hypothetical protein